MDLLEQMKKARKKPDQPDEILGSKKPVKRISTIRKSKKQAIQDSINNLKKYYTELPIEFFWSLNLNISAIGENRKVKK